MKSIAFLVFLLIGASAFGQVLYDNGPMATGTTHSTGTAAPTGTQWSEIQSVPGVGTNSVIGYSVNYLNSTSTGPLHQADDFTVTGAGWQISSIIAYGFRSGGSTAESFTTGVLRIWNGVPGSAGASIVAGDLTTNVLTATTFTNLYRTGRASGSTTRPIMAATLTLQNPVALAAGTYWMDYGLTSAGNTFAPLVTRPGEIEPAGANAMLFTSNQWFTMTDTNSGAKMEVPFQVIGTPVPEPVSIAALGLGLAALLRKKRN